MGAQITKLICFAFISTFALFAHAEESKNYAELGIGQVSYEEAGARWVPVMGKLSLGTILTNGIAIEGMVATGLASSSISGVTLKFDNAVAAYVRP